MPTSAPPSPVAASRHSLRIVSSGDAARAGEAIALNGRSIIGRQPDCAIVLADPGVSRQHASVEPVDGGVRVVDLQSANGVWADTTRITDTIVGPAGRFRVGDTVFECVPPIVVAPAPVEPPASDRAPTIDLSAVLAKTPPPPGSLRLHVVEGGEGDPVGRDIVLGTEAVTIGREADCTLVLAERDVSRHHARVERTPEGYALTDLGSTCGTWIGAREITTSLLWPGDRFRVGNLVVIECLPVVQKAAAPAPTEDDHATRFFTADEMARAVARSKKPDAAPAAEPAHAKIHAVEIPPPPQDVNATHLLTSDMLARAGVPAATPTPPPAPPIQPAARVEKRNDETSLLTPEMLAKAMQAPPPAGPAAPVPAQAPSPAAPPPAAPPPAPAKPGVPRLEQEGDLLEVNGHQPIVLNDPDSVWYVVEGGVLIFTVTLENGEPVGTRAHFLDVAPTQAFFGFDLARDGNGSAFLAVPKQGTKLRKLPVARLRQFTADPAERAIIARVIDAWLTGLCAALLVDLAVKRTDEVALRPDAPQVLDPKKKATSGGGVLWLDAGSGALVFNDIETPTFTERGALFPVTTESWIRAVADEFGDLIVTPVTTAAAVTKPALWQGLTIFHRVLCECEFVTRKLTTVDEYVRLQQKEQHAYAAREAAYGAIGSVLSSVGATPQEFLSQGDAEPVLRACEYVGKAMDLDVRPHPSTDEGLTYEQRVSAIASASGFRTRIVALRDRWFDEDNGPMLGQTAELKEPVALLPTGPTSYECVDPVTGERKPVNATLAATLSSFAYEFYRPFPDGKVRVSDVIKFGAHGMRRDFLWVVALSLVVGLFGTVTPYITGQVFDSAIPQADKSALVGFGLALLVSAIATSAFKFTQGVATIRIQARMGASIQGAVWDRILNLPVNFFRKYSAGDLADRADGVEAIQELVSGAAVAGILGSVSGLFYVVQMFGYDTHLAVLAVVLTGVFVGFNMTANYLQLRYQRVEFQLRGRISGLVLNLLTGVTKLRISGAEQHAFRVWAEQFAKQRRISFSVGTVQNFAALFGSVFPILSSIMIFATMLEVVEGGGSLTTGDFIAFNTAYGLFLAAMQALGDSSLSLLRVVPIYERLEPVLSTPAEVDRSKAFPGKLKGDIELSHVFFRYEADGPWIVKDMSLKISAGEFVAFVGSSGGGKSTVLRLLLGFEQPTRGAVLYDGQDLNSLDLRMVRQQIGVVLQASRVMPTEIYRNIAGVTTRSIEDAWDAAEKAGLAEDIRNMPMGMHTYVSEGGGTLSGGQRQRLMIARAIVNKPKILFLDEATSALDNKTQNIVTESMDKMDATRIVIAHRLSTIVNAHRICYLDGGTIAEMGSYEELMAKNGLFAQLARRQMA